MNHDYIQRGGELQYISGEQQFTTEGETVRCIGTAALAAASVPMPVTIRRSAPVEPTPVQATEHNAACEQLALPLRWPADDTWNDFEYGLRPDDVRATHQLLANLTEVLDGRRPLVQLRGHLDPHVYAAVAIRVRHSPTMQGLRLHSVHACRPAEDVIEACATLVQREKARAMVARLEARRCGWSCTVLRLV